MYIGDGWVRVITRPDVFVGVFLFWSLDTLVDKSNDFSIEPVVCGSVLMSRSP